MENLKKIRQSLGKSQTDIAKYLEISRQGYNNYENNKREPDHATLCKLADYFNVSVDYLLGNEKLQNNIIEVGTMHRIPILGHIPAGMLIIAFENIEGYEYADVKDPENHFFLRVVGDSMIGARIMDGDLVLIRKQPCAESGQIVACRVNGDEVTLKRFKLKDNSIFLFPENSNYEPIILTNKDFINGYAEVIGIAVKIHIKL